MEHAFDLMITAFVQREAGLAFAEDIKPGGQGGNFLGGEMKSTRGSL